MNNFEELIETLKLQEKQLLEVIKCIPQNDAQKAIWEKALIYLKKVGEYLDIFLPERKGKKGYKIND